jgi:hypothetical protein
MVPRECPMKMTYNWTSMSASTKYMAQHLVSRQSYLVSFCMAITTCLQKCDEITQVGDMATNREWFRVRQRRVSEAWEVHEYKIVGLGNELK